jgi:hypothetical protein
MRVYVPAKDRNLIGKENKNRCVIYQWTNLITGAVYIGSTMTGAPRLTGYFYPSTLSRN